MRPLKNKTNIRIYNDITYNEYKTIQFDDETFFLTYNNDDENQNNNI